MSKLPEFDRVDHFDQEDNTKHSSNDTIIPFIGLIFVIIIIPTLLVFEYNVKSTANTYFETHTSDHLWNIIQTRMDLNNDTNVSREECRMVYAQNWNLSGEWACSYGLFGLCSTASCQNSVTKEDIAKNPRCVQNRMIYSLLNDF